MRRRKQAEVRSDISILALDDDPVMTLTIQSYFQNSGYRVDTETDPYRAIARVREGHYDILLLDFLMMPICGDQVVEEIRKFNSELFIVMLTGHKSMAPPLKTIRQLDIQGYYEKSDRFDQLELLIESCVKSIRQMRLIREYHHGLSHMLDAMPILYGQHAMDELAEKLVSTGEMFFPDVRFGLSLDLSAAGAPGKPCFYGAIPWLTEEAVPALRRQAEADAAAETSGEETSAAVREAGGDAADPTRVCALLTDDRRRALGLLCAQFSQEPTFQQRQLLSLYARQSSAAVVNVLLRSALEDKNREITRTNEKLNESYMDIVRVMRLLVDAKDLYTRGHSDRVAYLACRLAQEMGKSGTFIENLRIAGLFHDIGKVAIPDGILTKPGALTDEEFRLIKAHPERGAQIMSALSAFQDTAEIIRQHHERYDGRGYPAGLSGAGIREEARMIALADAFDAMTSDRSYRAALSDKMALEQLQSGRGRQFDPEMTDVFINRVLCDLPSLHRTLAAIVESL